MPVAAFVLVLELLVAWKYRAAFSSMLRARVSPAAVSDAEPEILAVQ